MKREKKFKVFLIVLYVALFFVLCLLQGCQSGVKQNNDIAKRYESQEYRRRVADVVLYLGKKQQSEQTNKN